MKHLIKISSALIPSTLITLGFGFPFLLAYLMLKGYIIISLALIIFIPCFITLLAQEYR